MSILDLFKSSKDTLKVVPIPERLKKNQNVLIITADKTQDLEFFYPYYRLTEEGYTVDVATPEGGEFEAKNGFGLAETKAIGDVRVQDYELLYIPGGKAPAELRENEKVITFVKQFAATGKPVAAICHGAQVLISADLINGRQIAAWPEIKDEVEEAGATFVDEALVIDGQFITSRMPGDLHRHLYGVIEQLNNTLASTATRGNSQKIADELVDA